VSSEPDDGLTLYERSVQAVRIPTADLRVTDVLVLMGACHRVDRIELGRVVYLAGGLEMALTSPECRILPRVS